MKLNVSGMSYNEIVLAMKNSSVKFEGFTRMGDEVSARVFPA